MATTTTEFDPGPHKVEKPDPAPTVTNRFGSRREMLNVDETKKQFPDSAAKRDTRYALQDKIAHCKNRKELAKLEAELALIPWDNIWVVLDDELGSYATTVDRLDSGLADGRRFATSRLGKLLGREERV